MTRFCIGLLFGLLWLCAMAAAARAEVEGREPYEWVRSLRAVQDQVALGSDSAAAYQPKLIEEIAGRFAATDTKTLLAPRNVRAAVSYVLSGGQPQILRVLMGLEALPETDRVLVGGVLAYAEGKYSRANVLLDLKARSLDSSLGGQIALVQSILTYKSDVRRAIAFLDDARLLSTGTLVEEAALRRQTVLVALVGDFDRFIELADQYFRRFGQSIYATYFREQFAIAATSPELGADRKKLLRLERVVNELNEPKRLTTYLMLAETATFRGRHALGMLAATNGGLIAAPGSIERVRCDLYKAASQVGTTDAGQAGRVLQAIDKSRLGERDLSLLDAALMVAADVEQQAELSETPAAPSAGDVLAQPADAEAADHPPGEAPAANAAPQEPDPPAAVAARTAIASADQLLNGRGP